MTARLLLFVAVGLSAQAQSKPNDVAGWDKITWNMTVAQVRAAYHVEAQPETKDDWTLLQLNPVNMSGVQLGVQVGARLGVQNVSSIRLWSHFGIPNSPPGASAQDRQVQIVGSGNNDHIRFHLVEHLGVVSEELDAGRHLGLRLLNQLGVDVRNGHQLSARSIQQGLHAAPHMIVVKADNAEAAVCRVAPSRTHSQPEEQNPKAQLLHGITFLSLVRKRTNASSQPGFYYKSGARMFFA